MIGKTLKPLSLFLSVVWLSACTMAPKLVETETEERLPDSFQVQVDSANVQSAEWWSVFNDPSLNRVVDSAIVRNLDLKVAISRVRELQEQYRISRAALLPSITYGVDGNRSDTPANVGFAGNLGAGNPDFPDRFTNETYSATLNLSYELDFWGRVRSNKNASLAEYFATQADAYTALMGVISESVNTYFEVRDLEDQIALNGESIELLGERVELSDDRYERGLINSFELYTVRQEYESTRTSLPSLNSQLKDAKGRLAIILGMFSSDIESLLALDLADSTAAWNDNFIPSGIPSDLLLNRPDVVAAWQRLDGARHAVGAARAQQFPTISLTGTGGTQSGDLKNLLEVGTQYFSNLAASVAGTLFNGGALRANTRASKERLEQASYNYEKVLLTAFKEVDTTLDQHANERLRLDYVIEELDFAEASVEEQRSRYRSGVGDYLALLDAERNLIRVKTSKSSIERSLAASRLALHRALGGNWLRDLNTPEELNTQ